MPIEFMMEKELRELETILESERRLFVKYLEKLTAQQKQLIENDLQGLRESISKINLLAQEAITLESGRKNVIAKISKKLNTDKENVTLNNLLERFKGYNFEELDRLRNAILETHAKATVQRERNELLINQSMSVIGQTVNYLNERNNPSAVYENPVCKNGGTAAKNSLLMRTA